MGGRAALVTGGSRGLGLAIARGLARAGARVLVTARRREWLEPAVEEARREGLELEGFLGDVSDAAQARAMVARALELFGGLDVLVNNAGRSWGAPLESMPPEKWREVLEVNLTGPFLLCQAAAEALKASGRGRVINVASVAGLVGAPASVLEASGYTASKGGLIALTRDLAVKWAPSGVTVNAIAPGFIPTRLAEGNIELHREAILASIPMGRLGREEDVVGAVLFFASDAAAYVTGQVLAIDGGMTAQ
ncbi:MAG: 3-oxoacyl-ACP reductase FabG [Clostridia bacterium]|nr:3-oxoacyl-ACP reductase FabG [Clostridia bacterium]